MNLRTQILPHWKAITILVVIALLVLLYGFRTPEVFLHEIGNTDTGKWIATNAYLIRESILTQHEFPLWTPAKLTEPLLLAEPQTDVFSLTTIFSIILPTEVAGIKIAFLAYYILAGIGMYAFLRSQKFQTAAIIGAAAYMLNASVSNYFIGYTFMGVAYAAVPWLLLTVHYAAEKKKAITYGVATALICAVVFHAGGAEQLLFIGPLIGLYTLYRLGTPIKKKQLIHLGLFIAITFTLLFGLVAVKLFPSLDLLASSNRQTGFEYQQFLGTHITADTFIPRLIKDPTPFPMNLEFTAAIGIICFLLVLASMLVIRRRRVFIFGIALLMGLILMTENPITYFIWKFAPFYSQSRNLMKFAFIFSAASAILAAAGFDTLWERVRGKFPRFEKRSTLVAITIIALMMIEIGLPNYLLLSTTGSGYSQYEESNAKWDQLHINFQSTLQELDALTYISNQPGIFRFKEESTKAPFGVGTTMFNARKGLQDVYGINNIWNPQYVPMLSIAEQTENQALLYGILNVKYITSIEPLTTPSYKLVHTAKLPPEPESDVWKQQRAVYGPYVYENKLVQPRAFGTDTGILVFGNNEPTSSGLSDAERLMYYIMISPGYDPSMVLILSDLPLSAYTANSLATYRALIIDPSSLTQSNLPILQQYVASGGRIVPDILNNKQTIDEASVRSLFNTLQNTSRIVEAEYLGSTWNNNNIRLPSKRKFLVVSEPYAVYGGWVAHTDTVKLPLLRANGAITALDLKDESTVKFSYKPLSVLLGGIISLITLFAIIPLVFWGIKIRK